MSFGCEFIDTGCEKGSAGFLRILIGTTKELFEIGCVQFGTSMAEICWSLMSSIAEETKFFTNDDS